MRSMFDGASAFDQDLGWCVDDVNLNLGVRLSTSCESNACGVAQGRHRHLRTMGPSVSHCRWCVAMHNQLRKTLAIAIGFIFGACVCPRRRKKKKDETYAAAACRVLCGCLCAGFCCTEKTGTQ